MTPKQRALYRQEQDQLKKEIQIERQQNTDQQLEQIGQELEQLQELEQQPLSQRDVSKELQRKAELQAQLDQLGNQTAEQPSSPAPFVPANIEQFPIPQRQPSQEPITFCVGCQSNEDAILFLNGEPSACSVIPGSTKPLTPPAAEESHQH